MMVVVLVVFERCLMVVVMWVSLVERLDTCLFEVFLVDASFVLSFRSFSYAGTEFAKCLSRRYDMLQ
jgi:hypothetical protein